MVFLSNSHRGVFFPQERLFLYVMYILFPVLILSSSVFCTIQFILFKCISSILFSKDGVRNDDNFQHAVDGAH